MSSVNGGGNEASGSETAATIEEFPIEGEGTEAEEVLVSDYESVPCEKEIGAVPLQDMTPKELLCQFKYKGTSLYEHLTRLLELLISTRPENTIDYFDQFSRALRQPKGIVRPSHYLERAIKLIRMFASLYSATKDKPKDDEGEEEVEDEEEFKMKKDVSSFLEFADYFQEMGVGLPKNEIFQIDVSIRNLAQRDEISKARFWGKIFGTQRSYIVAECELKYSEMQRRLKEENEHLEEGDEEEESIAEPPPIFGFSSIFKHDAEEEEEIIYKKLYKYRMPPLPVPIKEKKIEMRKEDIGEGANKKVYYVCHEPGDDWVPLPDVLPAHIVRARQIRKYFKGFLLAEVDCFPPFPGKEREYLRAQIARISAGTHISLLGYYQFGSPDEMGEMEGEGGFGEELLVNLDYEQIPYQDMLSTDFWVHHVPHILRIGRTTYWEPPKHGEEMEEEEEPAGKEDENKTKEVGPPLLTPLSEDVCMFAIEPWTIQGTSKLIKGSGAIGVKSNLWPGAYAIGKGRIFENVYLGNGLKVSGEGYSPVRPPFPQKEYVADPEIMEANDPTPEEEEEWRKAHEPPPLPIYHGEGEEGEEEKGPIYSEPESDIP